MMIEEKIAKAIYEGRNGAGAKPWILLPKAHREPYIGDARAALAALSPTDTPSRSPADIA